MGFCTLKCFGVLPAALLLAGCASSSSGTSAADQPDSMRQMSLYGPSTAETGPTPSSQGGLEQVSFVLDGNCTDPCIDRRGRTLAFASDQHGPTHDIYVRPVDGTTVTRITTDTAEDVMPTFSPDGRRIAFASNRSGQYDIYVIDLAGGHPTRITNDLEDEYHPSWSPDGRMLVWSRTNTTSNRNELWAIDLQQPGRTMFIEYGTMPEWSPDPAEAVIAFQRARQRGSRLYSIWTIELVDGQPGRPTEIVSASNAAAINPSWSPDGRSLAFATVTIDRNVPEADALDVWSVLRDGTNLQHMTMDAGDEYLPTWSSDGRLYFVSSRSGNANIWSVAVDGGTNTLNSSPRVADAAPDDP